MQIISKASNQKEFAQKAKTLKDQVFKFYKSKEAALSPEFLTLLEFSEDIDWITSAFIQELNYLLIGVCRKCVLMQILHLVHQLLCLRDMRASRYDLVLHHLVDLKGVKTHDLQMRKTPDNKHHDSWVFIGTENDGFLLNRGAFLLFLLLFGDVSIEGVLVFF